MAEPYTDRPFGDTPPRGIHWSHPGAIHQARWMGQKPVSMKMFMFAEQLEYDEETVVKLERLNLFSQDCSIHPLDVIYTCCRVLLQMICKFL
ncbi:hypothetical protein GWK47_003150 [Chionoecetes opilio]|uniref:Uncharacterized protein n=1 Tax=Chionoecetes opilio TaxID=41210 RepID=A0A8J8WA79_CHIOP|nr:hypothetical protein GWK47_003150 [Chionoecetes opilio]